MNKITAIDLETHLFGPENQAPPPVCISSFDGVTAYVTKNVLQHTQQLSTAALVGHNVAYDLCVLYEHYPQLRDWIWSALINNQITDTLIREKLLDIAENNTLFQKFSKSKTNGYSLAHICKRRLGINLDKDDTWRLRYAELENIPIEQWPQEAIDYSQDDSVHCRNLYLQQEERAKQINYPLPTQYEETRAQFALNLTTARGVRTDYHQVKKIWDITTTKMDTLADKLIADGVIDNKRHVDLKDGTRPLPVVKKKLKHLRMLIAQHYPGDPPLTPKGDIATGKESIEKCVNSPLQPLIEFNQLQKTATTYIQKLFPPVVHASYRGIGAVSNRTSSFNPNFQNAKKKGGIRECCIPRDGYVFLTCDYDAQEMRTLAQVCIDLLGYSSLANHFRVNREFDPHKEFAANVPGLSRQHSKVANFGFPGGMGAASFVDFAAGRGVALSESEAQDLKQEWLRQWFEIPDYFKHISNLTRGGSGVQLYPRSGFRNSGVGFCNACNGYFQGLASHASKAALFQICREAYVDNRSALYGSRPFVFIHDEIGLETPIEKASGAAARIEQRMIEVMEWWTPDVPSLATAVLSDRWCKDAETIKDGAGRHQIWRYKQ